MNIWDNLVNAKHIDFVIESIKKHPGEWVAARVAARGAVRDTARGAVRDTARDAARDAAWYAARDAARDAAYGAAWYAAYAEARAAVRDAASDVAVDTGYNLAYAAAYDAILALVAYDDCEQYLDMSYNELLFMAKLTEIPATILLLPYAKAMELIKEKV